MNCRMKYFKNFSWLYSIHHFSETTRCCLVHSLQPRTYLHGAVINLSNKMPGVKLLGQIEATNIDQELFNDYGFSVELAAGSGETGGGKSRGEDQGNGEAK